MLNKIKIFLVTTLIASMILSTTANAQDPIILPTSEDEVIVYHTNFDSHRTVGEALVRRAKNENKTIFFECTDYKAYLKGENVTNLGVALTKFNIDVKYDRDISENVNNLVGRSTPKNILVVSDRNGLPAKMIYNLTKTSFYPETTIDLYKLGSKDETMELVSEKIPVAKNGDVWIEIPTGGRYLMVGKSNKSSTEPFKYERPQLFSIDELVTFEDDFFIPE